MAAGLTGDSSVPEVVRWLDEMIGVGPFQLENILLPFSLLLPSPFFSLLPLFPPNSVVICSIEILFY